jgi:uncharacterized SAM-binding protein YcdF (DUF218 family)
MKLTIKSNISFKNILRTSIWLLVSAGLAFIAYFSFAYFTISKGETLPFSLEKVDCIIVPLADNQTLLHGRCEYAASLYHLGYSNYIIVSGGFNEEINMTEASYAIREFRDMGIPHHNIILEHQAKNSWENFNNIKDIMKKRHFKRSAIITNDFHIYRCINITNHLDYFNPIFLSIKTPNEYYCYYKLRECRAVMFYSLAQRF